MIQWEVFENDDDKDEDDDNFGSKHEGIFYCDVDLDCNVSV